jgi:antitoxin PrlF
VPSATVTSKGRITVPRQVRERLRLRPGDRLSFRDRGDGTFLLEPEHVELLSLAGMLRPRRKGVTLERMEQAVAGPNRVAWGPLIR